MQILDGKDKFEFFYEDWSLTVPGVPTGEEKYVVEILNLMGGKIDEDEVEVYTYTGKDMNEYYHLTGDNAYPDDLHFVTIPLKFMDANAIAIPRFKIGGRWFTDIVDNNARREEEKLQN